jgi:hypothetical protein
MFFTFDQTNSGGSFTGPARFVIVEGDTAADATTKPMIYGDPFAAAWVSNDDGVRPTVLVVFADRRDDIEARPSRRPPRPVGFPPPGGRCGRGR